MKHAEQFLKLVENTLPRIREIGAEEVKSLLEERKNFLLIDVREDSEWATGHIPAAMHLGRGIIERDIESAVPDKAAMLVLYCGGGYRSALAADNVQKMGYSNVFSLRGGWREWGEKGFPKT